MFFRVFWLFLFASFWRFVITVDIQKDGSGVCPPVLDIIILFDTSGGNDTVFEQQKNWTIKIVRDLPVHEDAVRVGLVQYSDDARTEFNLSRYSERNDIIAHLETLTFMPGEDTKTGIALDKADEEIFNYSGGARLKATRLIIVFTDGLSMDKPTRAAKTLRRKGVKIYTISVNSIGFVPEMLGIVGDADNVFGPTDEDRIEERLLGEVEHARSCEVQPKRHEKTTSSFGLRTTEFLTSSSAASESSEFTDDVNSTLVTTTAETSETFETPEPSTSSSEEVDSENNVEDIGHNETVTTESALVDVVSTSTTPVSWIEPVQLFTVETESTHENKVQNLTNLGTSLSEESNTSEEKETENNLETTVKLETNELTSTEETSSTTTSTTLTEPTSTETSEATTTVSKETTTIATTPIVITTICVNPPTSTESPASSTSSLTHSTPNKSFLVKLGVEKPEKEKDPLSKFLGRDVPNTKELGTKKVEGTDHNNSDNISEEKGARGVLNSSEQSEKAETTKTSQASSTNRFFFSTRVTYRPTIRTSTTTTTTSAPTTTASTTTTPTTTTAAPTTVSTTSTTSTTTALLPITTLSTFKSSSVTLKFEKNEIKESLTKSTHSQSTPNQASSLFQTLSAVTAFPTLLSMEKAVTLPINSSAVSKPIKKKIRRIIKRRRNILPSSQAKKVTEKVLEVKRVPTPTTPPIRSTLRPLIVEEKEEIFTSGVQCPMDILFVVDSSGSIARTYDTQKDYLTQLIKKVEPSRSHRVGLIQFAGPHIQKMEWSFDTHSKNSQLLSAIRSVRHLTGTTYIGAALELSLILLDSRRKHTETTVILISDGFSQDDSTQQAKLLRQLPNVKMYAISLNKLTNTKYLTDIVGDRKNLFINDESHWFEEFFTKKLRCVPTTR